MFRHRYDSSYPLHNPLPFYSSSIQFLSSSPQPPSFLLHLNLFPFYSTSTPFLSNPPQPPSFLLLLNLFHSNPHQSPPFFLLFNPFFFFSFSQSYSLLNLSFFFFLTISLFLIIYFNFSVLFIFSDFLGMLVSFLVFADFIFVYYLIPWDFIILSKVFIEIFWFYSFITFLLILVFSLC